MYCGWLGWFEALNDRLIGPKTWDQSVKIMELVWTVRDSPRTVWAVNGIIYAINYVVMCMRSEWPLDFGFTRWN